MAQILTKVKSTLSNWAFKTIMTCREESRISSHKMSRTFIFKTITHFLNISYNSKKKTKGIFILSQKSDLQFTTKAMKWTSIISKGQRQGLKGAHAIYCLNYQTTVLIFIFYIWFDNFYTVFDKVLSFILPYFNFE